MRRRTALKAYAAERYGGTSPSTAQTRMVAQVTSLNTGATVQHYRHSGSVRIHPPYYARIFLDD